MDGSGYDIAQFLPILMAQELKDASHHYLTYNTLVLRVLKRISKECNVPWAYVLQQGPHVLDTQLHLDLCTMWKQQEKSLTMDEQHCIERVLGHDHVRASDLVKLAGILCKIHSKSLRNVWKFYAVDGFLGDDPKMYVDNFKYEPDEFRGKHVQAGRCLWDRLTEIESPTEMKEFLEKVFSEQQSNDEAAIYLADAGQHLKEIYDWKRDQVEKIEKKKRSDVNETLKTKKRNREDDQGLDDESVEMKPKRKRYTPKKKSVMVEIGDVEKINDQREMTES